MFNFFVVCNKIKQLIPDLFRSFKQTFNLAETFVESNQTTFKKFSNKFQTRAMSSRINSLYAFGDFRFDVENLILWRGEEMISMPVKALEVLRILLENHGSLVSKREIFNAVWADTFVEDGVLSQNIYTLRNVLGKDENGKQLIETVARRGYRFAAAVRILPADEVAALASKKSNQFVLRKQEIAETAENISVEPLQNLPQISNVTVFDFVENQKPFVQRTIEKRRSRFIIVWLILSFGVFVLVGAVSFYWLIWRSNQKNNGVNAPIEQVRFQRLTDSGDIIQPTISPNGEMFTFIRVGEREQSVYLKQIGAGGEMQILPPSTRGYGSLSFSPEGNYLYFRERDGRNIFQIPTFGGSPKKTAENVWSDFSISPDGKQIAFIRRKNMNDGKAIILSNVDGSGERELAVRKTPFDFNEIAPAFSPDGTSLVVSVSSDTAARPVLVNIDTRTGSQTELPTPKWQDLTRVLWMPDGNRLIVIARAAAEPASQIWMYNLTNGEARRLTNDLENYFWLSLSADGRKLLTRQQQIVSNLWIIENGDLQKAKQITTGVRSREGLRGLLWMPDGKIVFSSIEESVANLHSLDPRTGERVRLLNDPEQSSTYPSTSADGRFICYTSNMKIGRQIWRMSADGSSHKQLTTGVELKETAFACALSPDGSEIYFIKRTDEPSSIWKMTIEGGNLQPVAKFQNGVLDDFLTISPDGKWLAFRRSAVGDETSDATQKIGVIPVVGNSEPKLFDLPFLRAPIQWSRNSDSIYYVGGTSVSTLWQQNLDGGAPRKILEFPDRVFNFAFSIDGKSLTVARGKLNGDAILLTNLP